MNEIELRSGGLGATSRQDNARYEPCYEQDAAKTTTADRVARLVDELDLGGMLPEVLAAAKHKRTASQEG